LRYFISADNLCRHANLLFECFRPTWFTRR